MARKLAYLFYRLIKRGQQYVDKGTEYYETRSPRAADPRPRKEGAKAWHAIGYAPGDRVGQRHLRFLESLDAVRTSACATKLIAARRGTDRP